MIRLEEEKDYREVENLIREAFWNVYQPGCMEHFIMHCLRKDACFVPELDYIIEEDGKILAQIAYAKGTLKKENGEEVPMLLFGPVGVLPECQKKGYGKQLIEYTLKKAKELHYPAVVITGSPEYYHRFGFESASKHGIYYNGMDKTEEFPFFMVKLLDEEKAGGLKGVYFDPACYFVKDEDVERFDKEFPEKVKKEEVSS